MNPLTTRRPIAVLGHRGVRGLGRENTIEAFRTAAAQGADGVELDVRSTRDGELVVHHDAAVDGTVIAAVDHADARRMWPWLPTLDEALDACSGLLVNIEIKNDPREPDFDADDRVAAKVAHTVARREIRSQTIVSSFYPPTTARLREIDPELQTGQLLADVPDVMAALAGVVSAGHQAVNPWVGSMVGDVAGALVAEAHTAGLWVIVWTVNEAAQLTHLADAGVDGVIVDDPAAAIAILETQPPKP